MIEEKAYAKLNLALEVYKENEEGFHDLKTIMVPIDLFDLLTFNQIDEGIILLDNSNIAYEENIVYKAAKLFLETYNIKKGVLITLEKNIPSEAGLAGGSSDAAATLRGLNRLFNLNISLDELASLSERLGSDVPYCIYSRPAICTGRGTNVKLLDFEIPKWSVLLLKPPFGCSTKEIYKNYEAPLKKKTARINHVLEGLKEDNIELVNKNMFNDLETSAFKLNSSLLKLSESLNQVSKTLMSGSGSTLFILSKDADFLKDIESKHTKYLRTILTKLL